MMQLFGCGINLYGDMLKNEAPILCCPTFIKKVDSFNLTDVSSFVQKFTTIKYQELCKEKLSSSDFVQVVYGNEHALGLTEDGEVFSWGNGMRGQLGNFEVENSKKPQVVTLLQGVKIKQIAAGSWHSVALSKDGDVYSWGWNEAGQLGLPAACRGTHDIEMRKLSYNCSCKQFATSYNPLDVINMAQSTEESNVQTTPRLVDRWALDIAVQKVSCGSRHTLFLLKDGSVWSSGFNKYGQLGVASSQSSGKPLPISLPAKSLDIYAEGWNSLLLCYDI